MCRSHRSIDSYHERSPTATANHQPLSKAKQSKRTQHQDVHTTPAAAGESRIQSLFVQQNFRTKQNAKATRGFFFFSISNKIKEKRGRGKVLYRFSSLHGVCAHREKVFGEASRGECAFVTQFTAARLRQVAARTRVAQWRACALNTARPRRPPSTS